MDVDGAEDQVVSRKSTQKPRTTVGRTKHVGAKKAADTKKAETQKKEGKKSTAKKQSGRTQKAKSSSRGEGTESGNGKDGSTKGGEKGDPRSEDLAVKEADANTRITWEWICTAPIPTMKHVPKGIRREWGEILEFGMKRVIEGPRVEANWRLLMALPKLCLRTPPRGGRKKKGPSPRMCEWTLRLLLKARRGNWTELWEEAEATGRKMKEKQRKTVKEEEKQRES